MRNDVDWKDRSRQQWSSNPCGSETSGAEFGTKDFFEEIERVRYGSYSPWMKRDIGFDRHRGERLLEVGVGMGSDHLQWARGGAICTGIDLTPRCIEVTKRRFELYGLQSDLRVMDAEKLDFASESFDLVYSFGVLHHTPETQQAIDEIHRVLRPGGKAIVMLYHRHSLHVLKKILIDGIFQGAFARKSLHDMLGEGEANADPNALPLVKVYSRAEAMFLFRRFRKVDNLVRQLVKGEVTAPRISEAGSAGGLRRLIDAVGGRVPGVEGFRILFDSMISVGQDLTERGVEELGAVFGWNVIIFAEK